MKHDPVRPPRSGHDGENVYASMWAAAMAEEWTGEWFNGDEPEPIESVLYELRCKVEQRHATVVATVVCWLGTNMGLALTRRADSEAAAGRWDDSYRYLLAWTMENRRRHGVNSGVRLVEYMLTPTEDLERSPSFMSSGITKMPELSAVDLEVIDHLMTWLAKPRGQTFLRQCEHEIDRLRDEERRRRDAEWRRSHGRSEAAT